MCAAELGLVESAEIAPERVVAANPDVVLLGYWKDDERQDLKSPSHPILRQLRGGARRSGDLHREPLPHVRVSLVVEATERLARASIPRNSRAMPRWSHEPPSQDHTLGWLAAYLVLALLSTLWGTAAIPPRNVARVMTALVGLGDDSSVSPSRTIPGARRADCRKALLARPGRGAALACSRRSLAGHLREPAGRPLHPRRERGARLGAVIAIHSGLAESVFLSLPLCACVGGFAASLLVYALTYLGWSAHWAIRLLLTALPSGSMSIAGVSLVMILTDVHRVQELLFWLVGGVRNQTWEHVELGGPRRSPSGSVACSCSTAAWMRCCSEKNKRLAIGVPVVGTRLWVLVLTALATGRPPR